jgi:hypothetical protein
MTARKKQVTMLVTVSCPDWMTAAAARREVRTLINAQAFVGHRIVGDDWVQVDENDFRARKVWPA